MTCLLRVVSKAQNCNDVHIISCNYNLLTHTVNDILGSEAHNGIFLHLISNYHYIISFKNWAFRVPGLLASVKRETELVIHHAVSNYVQK